MSPIELKKEGLQAQLIDNKLKMHTTQPSLMKSP